MLFSRDNRDLDLHLVPEVVELCAVCDNVLSAPGGSLLLAGNSGVGRRAAVSVVSALHRAKLVTFSMGTGRPFSLSKYFVLLVFYFTIFASMAQGTASSSLRLS